MKIPVNPDLSSLCEQCVGLCCRYYAFAIDTPKTKRDFDDIRWYILHGNNIVYVEEGDWYIQINQKCNALMPDNRCAIYENRPAICREYTAKGCDWYPDNCDYDHLFTNPEQIDQFAKEHLAKQRRRRTAARRRSGNGKVSAKHISTKRRAAKPGKAKISNLTIRMLKSA
ncbi:MAG: YkgJ family cysteine cluster protein [Planctomycetota bacterium]|nr:MAG: YkgJ family cysteine cluster protein [Planctomycetota bacterium]